MDARSRAKLNDYLRGKLPKGFTTEEWDNFINYTPEGVMTGCRVLRMTSPRRHILLFSHAEDPFARGWGRPPFEFKFLARNGELKPLEKVRVEVEFRAQSPNVQGYLGWERVFGWWLLENGAMGFTGRGWAERCGEEILRLVPIWKAEHCGGRAWD